MSPPPAEEGPQGQERAAATRGDPAPAGVSPSAGEGDRRRGGTLTPFPRDATIATERLLLVPLRPEDAGEMVEVLADPRLHEFIGGRPAGRDELEARYAMLAAGSGDPGEVWCNWIARRRGDGRPVGTVQATVSGLGGVLVAQVAWVVGVPWQRQGLASEAAVALVAWLGRNGVRHVTAHIHPDHQASMRVAARAGLQPTADEVDGERVWRATLDGG